MKRVVCALLLSIAFTATAFASDAPSGEFIGGSWSGMLAFPKAPLLFVITFGNDGGKLSATASSPYQSNTSIPVDSVSLSNGKLSFTIARLDVRYEGTLNDNAISGTFTQHGLTLPLVLTSSAIGTNDLAGTWLGTLMTTGGSILLALHVADGTGGALSATLDSPYQRGFGIPVTSVLASRGTFAFAVASLGAAFSGKMNGDTIAGTFTQAGQNLPLTLARPAASVAADSPRDPDSTAGPDISLQTATGTIYGTLTLPAKLPAPVVLIVAGSGPVDRNGNAGTMLRTNAYEELAAALAQRGVASVRYDKRGVGASAKAAPAESDVRIDTYANDVAAWIRQLSADKRFSRTIVAGHSEGSLLGILALQRAKGDAFVSLEGAGRPAGVILDEQLKRNLPAALDAKAEAVVAQLEQGKTVADTPPELAALFRPSVQPYLISYMKYDPAKEIAKLTVPVTIVQGTADVQVTMDDANALKRGAPNAKLVVVQGMDHVLKHAPDTSQAGVAAAYGNPSLPIEPQVVDAVAAAAQ